MGARTRATAALVVGALALAACGSSAPRPPSLAVQQASAVRGQLVGTTTVAVTRHRRVSFRITVAHSTVRVVETCRGGGMLTAQVTLPGLKPDPFVGTCASPVGHPVVFGETVQADHPLSGRVTVVVQPRRGQRWTLGVGQK